VTLTVPAWCTSHEPALPNGSEFTLRVIAAEGVALAVALPLG